jgi:hypothetical protein
MARLWVLCASKAQGQEVNQLLASDSAALWSPQPHQPNTFQLVTAQPLEPASLAADLAKIGCPFEIEGDQERYLFHPGLGLKRQQLDEAGEVVLRVGFLRQQLRESGGSAADFERRLRIAEGQAWLDLLEPYRLALLRYDAMPRAV